MSVIGMICHRCQTVRQASKPNWYVKDSLPTCPKCYKNLWRHATGNVPYKLKYKPEYDQYVDMIRECIVQGYNMSSIERETGLYHKQIQTIAEHHGFAPKTQKQATQDQLLSQEEIQKQILSIIQQWFPNAHKFKFPDSRKELDIYIPEKQIAIEYCGLYWHCENSPEMRTMKYHQHKMLEAAKLGVRLVTIFEDEWLDRQAQVLNFLKSTLGINEQRVYARKCIIKQIDKATGKVFMDLHHIQGAALHSSISYGIYYKDELLGVMSGSPHHRQGHDRSKLVLDRLCFKDGVQVLGGASKLFKALVGYAKQNNYQQILSWSDNRWSIGTVYEALGFKLDQELKPDYSYVKGCERSSKQSLKKNPKKDDMSKTERELRFAQGYDRIWDCGKKRWVYDTPIFG